MMFLVLPLLDGSQILLINIDAERRGEIIDIDLMRSTLAMMDDLGVGKSVVYESDFEQEFLRTTYQFYTDEANEFLTHCTCPDYLLRVSTACLEVPVVCVWNLTRIDVFPRTRTLTLPTSSNIHLRPTCSCHPSCDPSC